jgi:hypothetical protein
VFLIYSVTPRACAQAIRKAFETGWRPLRFISSGCANKDTAMAPAGLEAANGILSVAAIKPYAADSRDPDLTAYADFIKARLPNVDPANGGAEYGYMVRTGADRGPSAVQERSQPRQPHGAGRQPEERVASAPDARHHAQHLADRLSPN